MNQSALFDAHAPELVADYDTLFPKAPPLPVQSQAEAHRLQERYRAAQIAEARCVALRLIDQQGPITVADLRAALPYLNAHPEESQTWLGSVFASPRFEPTGEMRMVGNAARNVHPKLVRVWRAKCATT